MGEPGAFVSDTITIGLSKEQAESLYKRNASGFDQNHKPRKFHYKGFIYHQFDSSVLEVIDRNTTGRFIWDRTTWTVGFEHRSDLTMFLLAYQENRP